MNRYGVVALLFVLSMITYIDRACIASAKDPVVKDLALSEEGMGLVFGAFALGYALAQIPSGWLADRFGPRLALTAVVVAWSACTALTGAAWSLASLVAIRFLFGVGEAGAFPGSTRAIRNWLPAGERGRANGLLFCGSRLGAALSFPLLAWLLSLWNWRTTFLALGLIGILWAVAWFVLFRDHPAPPLQDQLRSRASELALKELLRTRGAILAMAQYFSSNFTFFLCLSWMLPYLKRQYALGDAEAARLAMVPLLLGSVSQWIAGWMVDRLYRSSWRAWSRRIPAILGFSLAAAGILALAQASAPDIAVMCFALAAFGADLTISPSWVFCADLAGRHTGSFSGSMNMTGNLGSFVSASAFPFLQSLTGSATAYFVAAACLNLAGAACWLGMRSVEGE